MYKISTSDIITRLNRYINSIGNRVENADWYDFLTSSIRELKSGRTLPWQKIESHINLYTDIVKNPLPTDFDSFIKPSKNILSSNSSSISINANYSTEKEFRNSNEVVFGFLFNRDKRYLLSRYDGKKDQLIDNLDSDETLYTTAGDISNLDIDVNDTVLENSSLVGDIAASTNAFTISRTLDNQIDISDFIREGIATLFVKMPTVITSLSLKIGNNASNYYLISAITTQFTGDAFVAGWNTIKFDLTLKSEVGSVDDTLIDWFEISGVNTGVTNTNFKFNGLYLRLPSILDFPYNSKNIVEISTGSGTYQELIDEGTNMVIFDENFEDLLIYATLNRAGFFKNKDDDMVNKTASEYQKLLQNFNSRYPSNEEALKTRYYKTASRF